MFPQAFSSSVAKAKINPAGRYGYPLTALQVAAETHGHSVASSPSSDRDIQKATASPLKPFRIECLNCFTLSKITLWI